MKRTSMNLSHSTLKSLTICILCLHLSLVIVPGLRAQTSRTPTSPPDQSPITAPVPTPDDKLIAAVKRNQLPQAKKALAEGASINALDVDGTPLIFLAIDRNAKPLIQWVLEQNPNIQVRNPANETPLLFSVVKNKKQGFDLLILRDDIEINATNSDNETALFAAVRLRNLAYVKALKEKGSVINFPLGPNSVFATTVAYEARRLDILKVLLENNPLGEAVTSTDRVPLFQDSVDKNRKAEMELFLSAGANPNSLMPDGNPAIVTAILKVHQHLIQPLLSAGVSIHTQDRSGKSLLLIAHESYVARINETRLAIIRLLFSAKADPNTRTTEGKTLLQDYVSRGWEGLTSTALSAGADHSIVDNNGNHLIHLAVLSGKPNLVTTFLNLGADVNTPGDGGNTPLILATQGNNGSIVDLLLKRGSNVNSKNSKGETALSLAVQGQNLPLAKTLIQAGSDLRARNSYGNPLLMEICSVDSFGMKPNTFPIMDLLLQGGADVNSPNAYGNTCLSYSLNRKNTKMMEYLLKKGANPLHKDQAGNTILHKAVNSAFYERLKNQPLIDIFTLLLENIQNPDPTDGAGRTPLQLAAIQENNRDSIAALQVMEILMDYSANPSLRDSSGRTVIDYGRNSREYSQYLNRFQPQHPAVLESNVPTLHSLSTNSRSELLSIEEVEGQKLAKKSGGRTRSRSFGIGGGFSFPIPSGSEGFAEDGEGNVWVLGSDLGTIKDVQDKRCKPNENFVLTIQKYAQSGEEVLKTTEGRVGSCKGTTPITIRSSADGIVYAGAILMGRERNLYRIGSEGEWIPIAKPAGNWTDIRFLPNGNLVFLSDRYVEITPEGKAVRTLFPKKLSGVKAFAVTDEGDFVYTGVQKSSALGEVIWVEKYKGNGAIQWRKTFASNKDDSVTGVSVDSMNRIYLTGSTKGNLHGRAIAGQDTTPFLMALEDTGRRIYTQGIVHGSLVSQPPQVILDQTVYLWARGTNTMVQITGSP